MVSACEAKPLVKGVLGMSINNPVNSMTIVTAFFDIGRGDWTTDKGHPSYLHRDNQTYLSYFKNLATLDNEMVIFTSKEFEAAIRELRRDKPTKIVIVDINTDFHTALSKIKSILKSPSFQEKIPKEQQHNPEYWSEKYILITNLKTYFVNKAIEDCGISNHLVAWVDFGYCRHEDTLLNIKNWYYPFDNEHIHFFTLKRDKILYIFNNPKFPHKKNQVLHAILNNKVYIIGGVTVGTQHIWQQFFTLVKSCQKDMLQSNLLDDDQGVYLMCHYLQPDLFNFHYLGKNKENKENWFGVMQKFHE